MKEFKGSLKGFPEEVVEKMLAYQLIQRNKLDITVFEKTVGASDCGGGFDWSNTFEGFDFWNNVIDDRNFDLFFQKYPKKSIYPKVMMVSDCPITPKNPGVPRVVFMEKKNRFIAWTGVETLEESKNVLEITIWEYAVDIEEPIIHELTIQDISDGKGVGIPAHLIRIKQ